MIIWLQLDSRVLTWCASGRAGLQMISHCQSTDVLLRVLLTTIVGGDGANGAALAAGEPPGQCYLLGSKAPCERCF